MNCKKLVLMALLLLASSGCTGPVATDHRELKAFPRAADGMARFVIVLPHKERGEDDDYRVELVVGKIMDTDGVNQVRLDMALEPKTVEGWGYTRYEASGSGNTMGTLMAVPEGTPPVRRFVRGSPLHIRYNSRLPVVIYAPAGYEVRYRIWRAGRKMINAPRG